jgi:hypothetical protein
MVLTAGCGIQRFGRHEFVAAHSGGDAELAIGQGFHANNLAGVAHADFGRERRVERKRERELDGFLLAGMAAVVSVEIEEDAARAHIAGESILLVRLFVEESDLHGQAHRKTRRKAAFVEWRGHADARNLQVHFGAAGRRRNVRCHYRTGQLAIQLIAEA